MSRPRFLADHDLQEPIDDRLLQIVILEANFWRARELGLSTHCDPDLLSAAASAGLFLVHQRSKELFSANTYGGRNEHGKVNMPVAVRQSRTTPPMEFFGREQRSGVCHPVLLCAEQPASDL